MLKQLVGGLNTKNPRNRLLAARCLKDLLAVSGGEPRPRLVNTTPPVSDAGSR
ncbi:hypothetical protein [Streptomyces sp. NPDC058632]|uniref:hypothetical protein n=1 Tax=unclassified Streptomyces TaxID=2593676 RepID=UPI00364F98F7